jgi:hypothetical protein
MGVDRREAVPQINRITQMPFSQMSRGHAAHLRKPDSGHTGTISITVQVRQASWNAMKPRIQCVLTQ